MRRRDEFGRLRPLRLQGAALAVRRRKLADRRLVRWINGITVERSVFSAPDSPRRGLLFLVAIAGTLAILASALYAVLAAL